ncbi:MAG: class I SAM-dependent methyltransferase, partial [Gammaproteobacteria bacterium]|nr:class I SAM-dependent methyltransferase [Gammaproteobacteria bacterium]
LNMAPCVLIRNDPGETRIFGYNQNTIEDLELNFLQFVHEISIKKPPITLEIAAGTGNLSWKVPLAFENDGQHYANDLSSIMMNTEFDHTIEKHSKDLQLALKLFIKKIPGDCLKVLNITGLKNKFDAIYVANLEQYFNPEQHQQFLELIEYLLAPGGQAFLCSNSYIYKENYPIINFGQEQSNYPYFIQKIVTFENEINSNNPAAIIRPDNNTPTGHVLIEKNNEDKFSKEELPQAFVNKVDIYKNATYSHTSNAFSPDVYRAVIELYPTLTIIDTFFVDRSGVRQSKMDYRVKRVAAIIKKII